MFSGLRNSPKAKLTMSTGLFNTGYVFAHLTSWEAQEIQRITLLSDEAVISEVHSVMNGANYSWISINRRLR